MSTTPERRHLPSGAFSTMTFAVWKSSWQKTGQAQSLRVSAEISKLPQLLAELEAHVCFIGRMRVQHFFGHEIAERLHMDVMEAAQRASHLRVEIEKVVVCQRRLQRAKDSSLDLGHD